MIKLNEDVIKRTVPVFREFINTDPEAKNWIDEREKKDKFFAEHFTKEKISQIDEGTLRELIHILWAFNFYTNKDYVFQEMLKSGLEIIKNAFLNLLYSEKPLSERYDSIRNKIRMMGRASISEILAHTDKHRYPIWNNIAKKGLMILGISDSPLLRAIQITGEQYQKICELMNEIRTEIAKNYPEFDDFLYLDFYLYYLTLYEKEKTIQLLDEKTPMDVDLDHDVIRDLILQLGEGMGFEVEKELKIAHGCQVDAIWRFRIGNLGTITYVFEVQRKGSRDSAILNLQRARKDPTVQKVIIVSTSDELKAFRDEISTLDENFRNSVGYFNVNDLQYALTNLENLKNILKNVGLLIA